jgi:formamidopyrimidine-DNA glycosylase
LALGLPMPELPEILLYINALEPRVLGETLERLRIASPSVLKTFDPPASSVHGKQVIGLRRLGKRIVFDLEDDLHIVVHLMIAGRFQWKAHGAPIPKNSDRRRTGQDIDGAGRAGATETF